MFLPFFLAYLIFFLAMWPRVVIAKYSDGPDFSYGIYLYAYPVQQLLVHFAFPKDPYVNMFATLILTLPLALAPGLLVEAPALRLKPHMAQWSVRRKTKILEFRRKTKILEYRD